MRKILTTALLSIAVALPVASGVPGLASAQDLEFRLDENGPSVRVDRDDRWRRDRDVRYSCSTERALDKAERMGLRRVRVADVDRRTIEVQGRKRNGERVYVTFSRMSRNCAVL